MSEPFPKKKRSGRIFNTNVNANIKLPYAVVETKLNSGLVPISKVTINDSRDYRIKLNAWQIYKKEMANVNIDSQINVQEDGHFQNVPTTCIY